MWVRSSTEGNDLHRQNAGDQVPTTASNSMGDNASSTYQPVGASMMSVRV